METTVVPRREIWEGMGDSHRKATALRSACRHTKGLREAVEQDLAGLREVHAELQGQQQRTLHLLSLAQSVAEASPRLRGRLLGRQDAESATDSPLGLHFGEHVLLRRSLGGLTMPMTFAGSGAAGVSTESLNPEALWAAPPHQGRQKQKASRAEFTEPWDGAPPPAVSAARRDRVRL
ncbi:unnamed protein product [Polarella glacialis]|uniref:Uncharacterized protein n=1 Tax=Polarella glacialis TaxID=89957 RepID=A0A813JVN9_POLGL|nr:unnamed protein product [Polarella glacialis]